MLILMNEALSESAEKKKMANNTTSSSLLSSGNNNNGQFMTTTTEATRKPRPITKFRRPPPPPAAFPSLASHQALASSSQPVAIPASQSSSASSTPPSSSSVPLSLHESYSSSMQVGLEQQRRWSQATTSEAWMDGSITSHGSEVCARTSFVGTRPEMMDQDLEASERSMGMEDDSLQDFFSSHETTPRMATPQQSPARRLKVIGDSVQQSLHNSLSALQQPTSMLHRQGSLSSLPVTMEESARLNSSKRHSKIPNWTGLAAGSQSLPSQRKIVGQSLNGISLASIPSPTISEEKGEVRLHALTNFPKRRGSTRRLTSKSSKSQSSNTCLYGVVLLVLSTLCIGVYYHYGYQPAHNRPHFGHHGRPNPAPFWSQLTLSPAARRAARQQPYLDILLKQEGMNVERLQDVDSDANKALLWLVHEDALQLEPDSPFLLQRWAVATLYLAMHHHDTPWKVATKWMTESSVCEWYGITCEVVSQSDWFEMTMGHAEVKTADHEEEDEDSQQQKEQQEEQVPDVVKIDLSYNNLLGTVPPEIKYLSQLMAIDVSHNQLTGSLPQSSELGHFLRLTDLRLHYNHLTGPLPNAIGDNRILKHLKLDHNGFEGTIPLSWAFNLRNLHEWTMQNNELTGYIPTTISGLKHLETLEWNDNQLTGELPFGLCTLTTLKTVKLAHNHLMGSIPSEFLLSSKHLQVLDLAHNQFTGHVPDVMDTSDGALRQFHLHHNDLSGRLPKTLGHLTMLTSLQVDHNHFSGWIPTEWSQLSSLEILRLQDNKIGGTMPSTIAELTKLDELQFQQNLLQPNLPKRILKRLTHLQYHDLGVYASTTREKLLDAEKAQEEEGNKKKQTEEIETAPEEEGKSSQLLSSATNLQDLHAGVSPEHAAQHHFDEDEM